VAGARRAGSRGGREATRGSDERRRESVGTRDVDDLRQTAALGDRCAYDESRFDPCASFYSIVVIRASLVRIVPPRILYKVAAVSEIFASCQAVT